MTHVSGSWFFYLSSSERQTDKIGTRWVNWVCYLAAKELDIDSAAAAGETQRNREEFRCETHLHPLGQMSPTPNEY